MIEIWWKPKNEKIIFKDIYKYNDILTAIKEFEKDYKTENITIVKIKNKGGRKNDTTTKR